MKVTKSDLKRVIKEELQAVLNEVSIGPDNPNALLQAVERHLNQSSNLAQGEEGIRADELFNTDKGYVWKALEAAGHSPDRLQYMQNQVREFYTAGQQIGMPSGGYVEIIGQTPRTSLRWVPEG